MTTLFINVFHCSLLIIYSISIASTQESSDNANNDESTQRYPTTTTTQRYSTTTTTPWYPTTTTNTWYPTTRTTTRYPTSTTTTTVPAGVCPDDWIESLEGCFLFQYTGEVGGVVGGFWRSVGFLERLTWREAQDVCEGLGGYLAEIRSEEQQTFLVRLLSLKLIIRGLAIIFSYAGKYRHARGGVHWLQVLVHWSHRLRSWGKVVSFPMINLHTIHHS